jgi:hypothetical protein
MCHMPTDIAGDENIVRVILCPTHVKEGSTKVRHQAFRSRPGTDEVSVIRHSYKGSDFCKQKGKEIEAGWPKNFFVGLSVIRAVSIRECGSTVHDSREEYCGHAHISNGFIMPPNEPPASDFLLALTERCKAIVDKSVYHPDRYTASPKWTGAAF